jgi:mannose-1-phosphate guanylyltransferase
MLNLPAAPRRLAVILAGGRGTRFWPRSRDARPKQFLAIGGSRPLLEETMRRLDGVFRPEDIFVLTTPGLAASTRALLPTLPAGNVLVEPEGRNTGPCLALALAVLERRAPGAVMTALSADAWIGDRGLFLEDLERAMRHAAISGDLVTFGIRPAAPETGYGYIEAEGDGAVRRVRAFHEKPDLETALQYLASGRHFWNAGMFVWTLAALRAQLQRHCPELLEPMDRWSAAGADPVALPHAYTCLPALSIDHALLERSDRVALVPARFPWSDLGSWSALAALRTLDADGNVMEGDGFLLDSSGCAVFGGQRLVAGAGLKDLIVVDTPDALLICHKDRAQDVKRIVQRLKADGREELL